MAPITSRITWDPPKRREISERINDLQRKLYLCKWQLRWYPFIPGWYGEREELIARWTKELKDLQRLLLSAGGGTGRRASLRN